MFIGPMLVEFLKQVIQVRSTADLHVLMLETTQRLGLEQFALVSHVDLIEASHEAVAVSSYHEDWVGSILSQRYYLDDPVHAASTCTVTAFPWHAIRKMICPSRRQDRILQEGVAFGLHDGVSSFFGACNVTPCKEGG